MNPIALYSSHKLDKRNPTQKLHAENFINDVLFEVELGNSPLIKWYLYLSQRHQFIQLTLQHHHQLIR